MGKNTEPSESEQPLTDKIITAAYWCAIVLLGIVVVNILMSPLVNIPPGSVGILFDRLQGGVQTQVLNEGWHIAIPFTQSIYPMEVRTVKNEYPAEAASKDLQVVASHVAVSYHVIPSEAPKVYKEIGTDFSDKMIAPAIQETFKASTAKFNAEDLIQQREIVKTEVTQTLQNLLTKYGIKVDEVSIVNFQFSSEFNQAIEQKVVAQQNKLTAENVLMIKQVEAQQRMAEAGGIANSTYIQAQADAQSILVRGQAQAEALRLQKEQVNQLLISLKMTEKWDGQLPQYMMGGNTNPLLMLTLGNGTN